LPQVEQMRAFAAASAIACASGISSVSFFLMS